MNKFTPSHMLVVALAFLVIIVTGLAIAAGPGLTGNAPITVSNGEVSLTRVTAGSDGDSVATESDSGLEVVDDGLTLLRGCSDGQILKWDDSTDDEWECAADTSGGGGTPNVFDIGDDGGDDSTDLVEIATTGDTNSVITESAADKMLIDFGNNWPSADTATALAANGANCGAGNYPLGVDASGAVESCTAASAGSAITFDIGDDSGNDSVDVNEIATTGDTNTIFTEPSADKILIAVGNNWPTSDTADALSANPTDCGANTFATTIAADGDLTCTAVDISDDTNLAGTANEITLTGDTLSVAAALDLGGNTSVEIPNGAAPTTNATGEIALDTTITDHQPLIQYYDGAENMTVIAVDTAELPAADNEIIKYDAATDKFVFEADATGAGGSAITFDIGDDAGDDSVDVNEIATTGDTNSIFTEPSADKILVTLTNNWPSADTADALDSNPTDCSSNEFATTIAANGNLTCAALTDADVPNALTIAGGTIGTSDITLVQGTAPTPTGEGVIEWETDDDHIIVGDSSGQVEFVPAEDVSGDATMTDAGVIEVTEADALESNPSACAANTFVQDTDANGDLTCDNVDAGDITAAAIDGDDINSNIAGRSLTLTAASPDTLDADAELYTDTKGIWFEDPTAADDFESIWVSDGYASTLTRLWCESDQTVTMMLQVDDGSPADVDTVDLICITTPDTDTALNGDATLADGDRLDLTVISVSGTPTWVSIKWTFTVDD